MSSNEILVKSREVGKGAARACRRKGLVPGVLYGKGLDSVPIALDAASIKILFSKRGGIHHIALDEPKVEADVMIQDVQRDSFTGKITHVDLHKISLTEKVKSEVPVAIAGEEELDKRGLILQRQLRSIMVECLPQELPEKITLEVSGFGPGDVVTCGEIKLPEGVRLVTSPSEVLAVVLTPKTQEAEEPAEKEAEEETPAPSSEAEPPK